MTSDTSAASDISVNALILNWALISLFLAAMLVFGYGEKAGSFPEFLGILFAPLVITALIASIPLIVGYILSADKDGFHAKSVYAASGWVIAIIVVILISYNAHRS